MNSVKPAHRLSNVDLQHQTANCSVCGHTKIYVGKTSKYGAVRRICSNKLRERTQDYQRRVREKKGATTRKPRHLLSEINTEKMRAICSVCGPTEIRKREEGEKHTYYSCFTKKKEDGLAYRRGHGIPPPNPSHHHLSQIDDEKQTAVCSQCGPARIYIIRRDNQVRWRCSNAQIEYKTRALQNNQRFIDAYKIQHGCQKCGYNADPPGLEFHGYHSRKKDCKLPETIVLNKKRLLQVLEQCIVLCAEHHRLAHTSAISDTRL